jgi:hypothetical protein
MTEAGIRATLWAGAAGVIADDVRLDARGAPAEGQGVSLFNRSGLTQRTARIGSKPCLKRII